MAGAGEHARAASPVTSAFTEWWIGLAAGMIPGGGQIYARRPVRALIAVCLFAWVLIPAAIEIPLLFGASLTLTLLGMAAGFGLLLLVPLDGAFQAMERHRRPPVRWPWWVAQAAVALVLLVTTFALIVPLLPFRRFRYPTGSMAPTLLVGDHVGADMRTLRLASLQVGDIVILESPDNPGSLITKRIAGLPGDTVELRGGILVLNGQPLGSAPPPSGAIRESTGPGRSYSIVLRGPVTELDEWAPQQVPEGHGFLLGDNRRNSRDSRSFGFVPESALRGRPTVIRWSTDRESGAVRWDRIGTSLTPAD